MSDSELLEPLVVERRGEGVPLLLVHGFTGCAADWRHVFVEPPAGRELIAVDLPGHGRSSAPRQDRFLFADAARRLAATLRQIDLVSEPVDAIGLSGGALSLLHLAQQQPELLRRLVLVSATTTFPPQACRLMAMMHPDNQPEAEWEAMRQRHPGGDEQVRRIWQWGRELQHSGDDVDFMPARLRGIQAPTLVVHGDRDPLYSLPLAIQLFAGLEHGQLWVVPGGGHGPIFGAEADAFCERALAFFAD